jgi:Flp pilus assembly protein TadG
MKGRFPRMTTMVQDRHGGVALILAILLLPMLMVVGLAVDYGFYVQAQSQLSLGADAAALHAVRAAARAFSGANSAAAVLTGETAGQQWFAAQVGLLANASVPNGNVNVSVVYTQNPAGFSSSVSFSGTVASKLGAAFGFLTYPIGGSASAIISNSYVEVLMLLDNSSSMAIAATTSDIVKLETATMCSTQSTTAGQDMSAYSWKYTDSYDYTNGKLPRASPINGACDSSYTGAAGTCFYPPTALGSAVDSTGRCKNGGGSSGTNMPQAPCAFACHTSSTNDYYALARSPSVNVTLRIDVVQQAAADVISALQSAQQSPNQFSVGIYAFQNSYSAVYPPSGPAEAGTDLPTALDLVGQMSVPMVPNTGDTNFAAAANGLAAFIKPAGDGSSQTGPKKSLFIVTDGMQDTSARVMGPMTSATNEQTCHQFKSMGINVYVLYTPYLPLPNPYYLANNRQYAEPATTSGTSPILAALQACASSKANFFQASDPVAIKAAMQLMLKSALNLPARVAQ